MTTQHTVAQVAAGTNSGVANSLHLISRIRGRFDVLEDAIARQDPRARLKALLQIFDLLDELRAIEREREAA